MFEAAGQPTQHTRPEGETLEERFNHSLGHGVASRCTRIPARRLGNDPLVPGDVLAVEPGCYRKDYGGVRLEDLVLVAEDGYEKLTDFPYVLRP